MPSVLPPASVIDAIESGATSVTRRAEFFEFDGATPWYPGDSEVSRLVDGTVTVDYNRNERRALDISFDNRDNALRIDPEDGLWYDKVIKTYRGVRVSQIKTPPRTVIVEAVDDSHAQAMRAILMQLGFTRTDIRLTAASLGDVQSYEIIVSNMREGASAKLSLLTAAWNAGKNILTVGSNTGLTHPLIDTVTATSTTVPVEIKQVVRDNPLKATWVNENTGATTASGTTLAYPVAQGARVVAEMLAGNVPSAIIAESSNEGRWFHYQPKEFGTQGKILLYNALNWMWNFQSYINWETQIGEFVIDQIAEDNFPHVVKVTGRDYTKRCLTSKFESTTSFAAGTPVHVMVRALGANAGIQGFILPNTSLALPRQIDVDRTTDRWTVMKKGAESAGYEIFFNPQGYLTMREFIDPSFGPLSWSYRTGLDGNLAKFSRSTNDSRLYNHIVITGESSEEGVLPFFGEARNTEPSSPTRIGRIGDRPYFYTSAFFTSNEQCIDLARKWLKIKALESYEINWDSFNYPWQEVGDVVEFLDPLRAAHEPTRYLLDTLSIPMGLGPMSATAKRVTFIGDPDSVPPVEEEEAA